MSDRLRLGLILDPEFCLLGKSVCALTPPLIQGLCHHFETRVIWDQGRYDRFCTQVDLLVSLEPQWAAPVLKWRRAGWFRRARPPAPAFAIMSDPHSMGWREQYVLDNELDGVLALYQAPTLKHFSRLPPERVIPFPWAVPAAWIGSEPVRYHGQQEVVIFGAAEDAAYATRNWCRQQPHVRSYAYSGCESKVLEDREYFEWLKGCDAVVAAGSEDPRYRLTLPKYFEAAAAGGLLFAQETDDLERLGFRHRENCLVFRAGNFNAQVAEYLADPGNARWLQIREAGRELVRSRHTVEHRLAELETRVKNWRAAQGPSANR